VLVLGELEAELFCQARGEFGGKVVTHGERLLR
jgi:hypothetical protein